MTVMWRDGLELLRGTPQAILSRWHQSRASIAACVAFVAAVALAYVEKRPLQSAFAGREDEPLVVFANVLGSGWAMLVAGILMLVLGPLVNRRALLAGVTFGVAGCWGFVFLKVGQFILAEDRPRDGGAMHFLSFSGHGVSGHACAAALLFFPVRDVLGRGLARIPRAALGLALFAWVAFVAWSRVRMNMHYVWNVMLGAGLGLYISSVTVKVARAQRA